MADGPAPYRKGPRFSTIIGDYCTAKCTSAVGSASTLLAPAFLPITLLPHVLVELSQQSSTSKQVSQFLQKTHLSHRTPRPQSSSIRFAAKMADDGANGALTNITLRKYNHECDYDQVVDVCGGQIDGLEQIPASLPHFASSALDHPYVLCEFEKIVAFMNAQVLVTANAMEQIVYLEGLRVAESEKGKGVGTLCVESIIKAMLSNYSPEQNVRFFVTTLSCGPATRIFQKLGWHARIHVHLWPATESLVHAMENGFDKSSRLLHALDLDKFVPEKATEAIQSWEELETAEHIASVVRTLAHHKCSDLVMKRYSVDTLCNMIEFLDSKWAVIEGRSVWKLDRAHKAPLVVFIRRQAFDVRYPATFCNISAIAHDRDGAEAVVAFMDSLKGLGLYILLFDSTISPDVFKESALLSNNLTTRSAFLVHNWERCGTQPS